MKSNSKLVKINVETIYKNQRADEELKKQFNGKPVYFTAYNAAYGTAKVATGLKDYEIPILMPAIIDTDLTDRDFFKKVISYFENIKVIVLYGNPLILEIGKTKDNNAPITLGDKEKGIEPNLPISPADFIKYRWLTGLMEDGVTPVNIEEPRSHPEIAISKDDYNTSIHKAWLENPDKVKQSKKAKANIADDALAQYLLLRDDFMKVNTYLALFGEDPDKVEDPIISLRSHVTAKPDKFLKMLEDQNAVEKYFIKCLEWSNVVIKTASSYMMADGSIAWDDEFSFISWIKNGKNKKEVQIMKQKLNKKQFETL